MIITRKSFNLIGILLKTVKIMRLKAKETKKSIIKKIAKLLIQENENTNKTKPKKFNLIK